jgi:hypothetical protein
MVIYSLWLESEFKDGCPDGAPSHGNKVQWGSSYAYSRSNFQQTSPSGKSKWSPTTGWSLESKWNIT